MGNQIPRIRIEPKRYSTDGDGAAMLMKQYYYPMDDWQKLVVDAWLGKDKDGKYNVTTGSLCVGRQNGKNFCITARELYGLLINGEKIVHSAHQVRVCNKAFNVLESIFTNDKHPEILREVKKIRYGIGEKCIELNNGGSIEFISRSKQAARGYDGISLLILDEAQEIQDEEIEAITSILASSNTGTRQMIYTGTPVYPGCIGTVFKRLRTNILNDPDEPTNSSWHEWSVAEQNLDDIDVFDEKLWWDCNPSLDIRLTREFTREEAKTLSKDGFCRERLSWWSVTTQQFEDFCISKKIWDSCASEKLKPDGKTAYGIKFSPDGSEVALCGAVIGADGTARISLIERKPTGYGISWLAEWLNQRYKVASCVVIDGKNGTDVLIDKIRPVWKFKDSVIKPTSQNVITAASLLINELNEKTVTWYKPQDMLRESAITSVKRRIGNGWGFGGSDSAPIEACALALYGVRTSKRNPQKTMRIG